jgi:sugar phosphate isomerase/epimerase
MMSFETSRRTFLGAAAMFAAKPAIAAPDSQTTSHAGAVKLGICSYSFGKAPGGKAGLADALPAIKNARVRYINIKPEFHLPYDSSPAQIAEVKKMLDDNGLILAGTGATYLTKEDMGEIRQRFEFNKALGSPLIVIGPKVETLPMIEKCVKEYDIKVAVHNHGPSDKHFPTPQSALTAIQGMDARVGLCMDIGHTMRSGVSPVEAAKLAGTRMLDLHTKDVRMVDGKWVPADCGDGDIDLPGLFRQLKKQGFSGFCNLEYEVAGPAKDMGIQRSMSYLRGVAAAV